MKPSNIVFVLGLILYVLIAILIHVGIYHPLLKATAQTFSFAILAIFTWLAMLIIGNRLDDRIIAYWHCLRADAKQKYLMKKRKKK